MDLSTAIKSAQKSVEGSLTPKEEDLFFLWMNNASAEEYQQVADAYYLALGSAVEHTEQHPELLNKIGQLIKAEPPVRGIHFTKTQWIRYAAILFLIAGTVTYLYSPVKVPGKNQELTNEWSSNISPGGNRATLTLADGSVIVLDSSGIGPLASQGSTKVVKPDVGSLVYNAENNKGAVLYNTIATPRGGQFRITLSDGSNVWLNAASSIRFPAAFAENERRVEITGEVYFEIKADAGSPFNVLVNEMKINVLGTSFNINAYDDEKVIRTTLITGSVRVNANKQTQLLMPGQQAEVVGEQSIKLVKAINTEQVMAWKNGAFNFEHTGFKEAMRQLERWYNIEVVYEKGVPEIALGGEISRNMPLQEVLKGLAGARVHFRMEQGRKLVIMP